MINFNSIEFIEQFNQMSDIFKSTRRICQEENIIPARSRGQNFLINKDVYRHIINIAALNRKDNILEVGPGLGFLTLMLASKVKHVYAVEMDKKLALLLKKRIEKEKIKNITVIQDNILKVDLNKLNLQKFKIVANLPYNITSIFLRNFLDSPLQAEELTLMLQLQVAERIVAKPPKMSLLAVAVQFFCHPELKITVNRDNFWPSPQVDSAIVKLKTINKYKHPDKKKFFRLVKAGFSSKRKMLKNNISVSYKISSILAENMLISAHLSPSIRAQELSLENWLELFGVLQEKCYN